MAENPAPILLISAGPAMRSRDGSDPIFRTAVRRMGISRPTIAYVGAASGENEEFRLRYTRIFQQAGAGEVTLAPLCGRRGNAEKAKAVIEASDLVYISGGDVDEGMRVLRQRGMIDFLRRTHALGKFFFGSSAGSIMLCPRWVRWPESGKGEAELFPCLDIAPVLCDTHGENEGWEELRALLALSPAGSIGYGLVSGTALLVEPDGRLLALGDEVDRFQRTEAGVERMPPLPYSEAGF